MAAEDSGEFVEDELAAQRERLKSIGQQAAEQEDGEDLDVGEQAQLDNMPEIELGELSADLRALIPKGMPVELSYSLMSAAITGVGGVIDPTHEKQLVVNIVAAGYQIKPVREDGAIRRYKVIVQLRPTYIQTMENVVASAA